GHELGLLRLPVRPEARVLHPQAVERAARAGPARGDAAALARHRMLAPDAGRLLEFLDVGNLAAHHAGAAGAARHDARLLCRGALVFSIVHCSILTPTDLSI